MNKKAQFYLIAAVVIIGMLVGLTTIYNFARAGAEDAAVYDLSSEINFEGSQVLANGVFNELSDEKILSNIQTLIEHESTLNQDSEFVGIYGNESSLTLITYSPNELGAITVDFGGASPAVSIRGTSKIKEPIAREGNKVNVKVGEQDYNFDLKKGQTLFIIVKKEKGEERFVASSGTSHPSYSPEP